MSRLDPLLDALPRWILVVGKGGVGKTTCAAALAARAAARGDDTLLLSTDPARSLGAALGARVEAAPSPLVAGGRLFAMQLDAAHERDAFLRRWRDVLMLILDHGTYLSTDEIAGFIDDALPGADEAMALLALLDLQRDRRWTRLVVDTAPTGHTLRLLALPQTFRAMVSLLDRMQYKHRFMMQALAGRYHPDAADAFIADMRERLDALEATLKDPRETAVALVVRHEDVVVAESMRYAEALGALSIRIGAVILNANPGGAAEGKAALARVAEIAPTAPRLVVSRVAPPPNGLDEIVAAFERAAGRQTRASGRARDETARAPRPPLHPAITALLRPLTIVAGKGGVGKTTVACALGVSLARPEAPLLVVSSDPAPSVADVLGQPVPDDATAVHGAAGLSARQMDATAAFERFRAQYAERVDSVFDRLMTGPLDLAHDRAVARDLMALAPPGIDELYALVTLGDMLAEARYASIIVDPAPTGHLLRLLEMPALTLSWTHRLMRLILEYKEVSGLVEAAQDLLDLSRRTRALREMMTDPARTTIIVVANDEPLVRDESARLISACRARGVAVGALVWNRASAAVSPLSTGDAPRQFVAPTALPAPEGVAALRGWCAAWRPLDEEAVA
ncbi:MAG TPA: TRC40/GET3/ArsA family transport-energizing ATPase [Gemmatimonadaceae bacterium]|nr:TRC40/GET3/ArsA family transport-energizing ATPase [Gemmatimonadaceae bacterium]